MRRFRKPFYGWYIVGVSFVTLFLQASGGGFTFSIFLPAMNEELGWSRSTIVGATSLAAITAAVAGPFLGRIVDRHGPRAAMTVSVIALGLAQLAASFVQEPWQFYLAIGLVSGAARPVLQSVGPGAMIAQWFQRRRSTAFGIASVGPPIANVLLPPLIAALVHAAGWRSGWVTLGCLALGMGLAPTLFLVRRRPEDLGLRPDGDPPQAEHEGTGQPARAAAPVVDEDWTAREALHSVSFWRWRLPKP
jgi:sugar phosphate permease